MSPPSKCACERLFNEARGTSDVSCDRGLQRELARAEIGALLVEDRTGSTPCPRRTGATKVPHLAVDSFEIITYGERGLSGFRLRKDEEEAREASRVEQARLDAPAAAEREEALLALRRACRKKKNRRGHQDRRRQLSLILSSPGS